MGLLSLTTIFLSLACLAILVGTVFAVILIWPHKTDGHPDRQSHTSDQPDQPLSKQEE